MSLLTSPRSPWFFRDRLALFGLNWSWEMVHARTWRWLDVLGGDTRNPWTVAALGDVFITVAVYAVGSLPDRCGGERPASERLRDGGSAGRDVCSSRRVEVAATVWLTPTTCPSCLGLT